MGAAYGTSPLSFALHHLKQNSRQHGDSIFQCPRHADIIDALIFISFRRVHKTQVAFLDCLSHLLLLFPAIYEGVGFQQAHHRIRPGEIAEVPDRSFVISSGRLFGCIVSAYKESASL